MMYKTPTFTESQQYNRPFSWGHVSDFINEYSAVNDNVRILSMYYVAINVMISKILLIFTLFDKQTQDLLYTDACTYMHVHCKF